VHPDLQPDRTYLFDLDPTVAAERRQAARSADRFEAEHVAFFSRVRAAYLARAAAAPGRFRVIDGMASIPDIRKSLEQYSSSI
jgi:dTMP kinase